MNNLGQQLQDARNALALSIREASERIHIRAEYLGKLEDNTFDIPLHPVYIRGFVRLYSRYLKLDADEMVELFEKRHRQIVFTEGVNSERKSLGQYVEDRPEEMEEQGIESPQKSHVFERYRPDDSEKRPPWIPIAGVGALIVIIFVAIFFIRLKFFPTAQEDPNESDKNAVQSNPISPPEVNVDAIDRSIVGLVAKAPVYIYVRQTADKEILFSGTLQANERKTLIRDGEISIVCEQPENLEVEIGGIPVELPQASGPVQFLVD